MNRFKRFSVVVVSILIGIFSVSSVCAVSSPDESVLTAQDDRFQPYTVAPDNGEAMDISSEEDNTSKSYELFYTQTTFLALLAGYLILFKVKGIDHSEKMHHRIR